MGVGLGETGEVSCGEDEEWGGEGSGSWGAERAGRIVGEGLYIHGNDIGFQKNLYDKKRYRRKWCSSLQVYGYQSELIDGKNTKASYLTAYASGQVPTRFRQLWTTLIAVGNVWARFGVHTWMILNGNCSAPTMAKV